MGRQALDRERPRHADDLLVLVRSVEERLGLGVAGDGGVDLLARHALVDVGVLGDRLEGHVRHALVDEAAADVVAVAGGDRRRDAAHLGFLLGARLRVGEQVVRVLGGHQARSGESERDAAGIDRDPAPPPLLGDVRCRAGATGRVEHQIARVSGHQNATLDYPRCGLDDVGLWVRESAGHRICPDVRDRADGKVVQVTNIAQAYLPSARTRPASGEPRAFLSSLVFQ